MVTCFFSHLKTIVYIGNGRICNNKNMGKFTSSSLVDYLIISADVFHFVSEFEMIVVCISDFTEWIAWYAQFIDCD